MSAAMGFLVGLIGMAATAILVNAASKARENPAVLITWAKTIVGLYRGQPVSVDERVSLEVKSPLKKPEEPSPPLNAPDNKGSQ